MTDFTVKLDGLIADFLAGNKSFEEFYREYSACIIDENADAGFSSEKVDYYGTVHEKSEWTARSLSEEERAYGWITPTEFREWLEVHMRQKP